MSLIIFNHQFPTTCHLLPVLQSMASLYFSWLHLHLDMNKLLKCYSNYWCFITSSYIGVSKFPSLKPLFWHKLPVWLSIRTISPNPGSNAPQRDETFSSTILLFCVAPPAGLLNWKSIQSQSNSHNFSRDCEKYSVLLRRKKNFPSHFWRFPVSHSLFRQSRKAVSLSQSWAQTPTFIMSPILASWLSEAIPNSMPFPMSIFCVICVQSCVAITVARCTPRPK